MIVSPRSQLGAIVPVDVAPSVVAANLGAPSFPGAQPLRIEMLLDTGSERSVLDEDLVAGWGLVYTSSTWAATINATKPIQSYEVMLTLVDAQDGRELKIDPLTVMARRDCFVGARYNGLLGRDVLDLCYFTYDGPGNSFTLRF